MLRQNCLVAMNLMLLFYNLLIFMVALNGISIFHCTAGTFSGF